MTDKEYKAIVLIGIFIAGLLIGVIVGVIIVALRYDSEIGHDQSDLQAQVDEIVKDKAKIDDLTQQLILHIEQLKLEREDLRRLQLELSKGEEGNG